MEQTFMTIHNLTPDANILYISESVVDILGYYPSEVLGRSCFDFFHPDEVPFARSVHSRGVLLDKAAVLHYARVLSRDGRWISCECCFTIVHDVLVACTSIYRRGEKSERRAIEAPQIRRIFSCSPRDPRYHMLEHLSPKFKMPAMEREPRAALILNRFTRTLSVMFATEAISSILGVPAEMVQHKSFYECIQESSLDDAFKCLESAKANDSIAYLRFWSRDPRRPEDFDQDDSEEEDEDEDDGSLEAEMSRGNTAEASGGRAGSVRSQRSSDSENGGVKLEQEMQYERRQKSSPQIKLEPDIEMQDGGLFPPDTTFPSRTTSSGATFPTASRGSRTYQSPLTAPLSVSPVHSRQGRSRRGLVPSVELEAVVSCTSDGLVVVLRKARPQIPDLHPPMVPFDLHDGLFAAPWAQRPIQPQYSPEALYTFRPPLMPQYMPLRENVKAAGGPPLDQLMRSIRDVAVFAWALVGINGNLASYGRGRPMGEAQPPEGLPIWDPSATHSQCTAPENQAVRRWAQREDEDEDPSYTPGARHSPGSHGPDARNRTMLGQPNYSLRSSDRWQTGMDQQHHYPRQPANDYIGSGDPLRLRNHGQTQFGTGFPTQMQLWDRADNHPFSPSREESRDYRCRWRS